jgi:hypothetical protein
VRKVAHGVASPDARKFILMAEKSAEIPKLAEIPESVVATGRQAGGATALSAADSLGLRGLRSKFQRISVAR